MIPRDEHATHWRNLQNLASTDPLINASKEEVQMIVVIRDIIQLSRLNSHPKAKTINH